MIASPWIFYATRNTMNVFSEASEALRGTSTGPASPKILVAISVLASVVFTIGFSIELSRVWPN